MMLKNYQNFRSNSIGITKPIIIEDTTRIKSLFLILNTFKTKKLNIKIKSTTIICAISMPRANSIIGNNFRSVSSIKILMAPEKPNPWISPNINAKIKPIMLLLLVFLEVDIL